MKLKWATIGIAVVLASAPITYAVLKTEVISNLYRPSVDVQAVAKQVTVRLVNELGAGSGVVVAHTGQQYTVLTNAHVISLLGNQPFKILTSDGRLHPASHQKEARLIGLDLGLVAFSSPEKYTVAQTSSVTANKRTKLYAAGFPNYRTTVANGIEDTRSWGLKAFHFTEGFFVMELKEKVLEGGYKFGYSNEVELGMSGGPVLDANGYLVGVNGRLKYPIQGIESFIFMDGTQPSQELFQRMEPLSWGVPISFLKTGRENI